MDRYGEIGPENSVLPGSRRTCSSPPPPSSDNERHLAELNCWGSRVLEDSGKNCYEVTGLNVPVLFLFVWVKGEVTKRRRKKLEVLLHNF